MTRAGLRHERTGHSGRIGDPLYGIRRMLNRRADRLPEQARPASAHVAGKTSCLRADLPRSAIDVRASAEADAAPGHTAADTGTPEAKLISTPQTLSAEEDQH